MTEHPSEPAVEGRGRSLVDQIGHKLRLGARDGGRGSPDKRLYWLALALVAMIPPAIVVAAQALAMVQDGRNRRIELREARLLSAHDALERAASARVWAAPLLTRPTVSGLAERLSAILPADATLHSLAMDGGGDVEAKVDCADPDVLRVALAGDPFGRSLRMVAQEPADGVGVRAVLTSHR